MSAAEAEAEEQELLHKHDATVTRTGPDTHPPSARRRILHREIIKEMFIQLL